MKQSHPNLPTACPRCGSPPGAACKATTGRAVRWHKERRACERMLRANEEAAAFTANHLRAWSAREFRADEVEVVVGAIEAFVAAHPEVIGPPRNSSWPDVWTLVQRRAAAG